MRRLVLACLLATPTLAQADLEVLAVTGADLAGSGYSTLTFGDVQAGVDGGWATASFLRNNATLELTTGLVGDRTPQGTAGLSLLRLPTSLAGIQQARLGTPVLAHGLLGYVSSVSPTVSAGFDSAWIEDRLVVTEGDPIGSTALTWESVTRIRPLPGGRAVVRGRSSAGPIVVEFPSESVLLRRDDVLPSGGNVVRRIKEVRFSADGTHWIARVDVQSGTNEVSALVLDGDLLTFTGGGRAVQLTDAPTALTGGAFTWGRFLTAHVDNRGRVTFDAEILSPANIRLIVVRDERLVLDQDFIPGDQLIDVTADSAALITNNAGRLLLDEVDVVGVTPSFDADGDGVADAGWERLSDVGQASGPRPWSATQTSSGLVGTTNVSTPSSSLSQALVRFRRGAIGDVTCPGVPSSTGFAASLAAFGETAAAAGDVVLQCIHLPSNTTGLGLVSANTGFVPMAGGGAGNLCLGGAIGRFQGQVFQSGEEGRGVIEVNLSAIPQPTGAVMAAAGQTWFFQVWYRDAVSGSNLSNAVGVVLD